MLGILVPSFWGGLQEGTESMLNSFHSDLTNELENIATAAKFPSSRISCDTRRNVVDHGQRVFLACCSLHALKTFSALAVSL